MLELRQSKTIRKLGSTEAGKVTKKLSEHGEADGRRNPTRKENDDSKSGNCENCKHPRIQLYMMQYQPAHVSGSKTMPMNKSSAD